MVSAYFRNCSKTLHMHEISNGGKLDTGQGCRGRTVRNPSPYQPIDYDYGLFDFVLQSRCIQASCKDPRTDPCWNISLDLDEALIFWLRTISWRLEIIDPLTWRFPTLCWFLVSVEVEIDSLETVLACPLCSCFDCDTGCSLRTSGPARTSVCHGCFVIFDQVYRANDRLLLFFPLERGYDE